MIDVYNPADPDAAPIKAFRSNIPAGYVPVGGAEPPHQSPAGEVTQDTAADQADTTTAEEPTITDGKE